MATPPTTTTNLSISMPQRLRDAMTQRMSDQGFENASEYVRHLIREDAKRAAKEKLEAELLEGEASGPGDTFDEGWLDRRKAELAKRMKSRRVA
jgi:antitoxin ParD1/3/4